MPLPFPGTLRGLFPVSVPPSRGPSDDILEEELRIRRRLSEVPPSVEPMEPGVEPPLGLPEGITLRDLLNRAELTRSIREALEGPPEPITHAPGRGNVPIEAIDTGPIPSEVHARPSEYYDQPSPLSSLLKGMGREMFPKQPLIKGYLDTGEPVPGREPTSLEAGITNAYFPPKGESPVTSIARLIVSGAIPSTTVGTQGGLETIKRAVKAAPGVAGEAIETARPIARKLATSQRGALDLGPIDDMLDDLGKKVDDAFEAGDEEAYNDLIAQKEALERVKEELPQYDPAVQDEMADMAKQTQREFEDAAKKETLATNPVLRYLYLVERSGPEKGQVPEALRDPVYRQLTGKAPTQATRGQSGRVPTHIAVDEAASALGMTTDEFINEVNSTYKIWSSLPARDRPPISQTVQPRARVERISGFGKPLAQEPTQVGQTQGNLGLGRDVTPPSQGEMFGESKLEGGGINPTISPEDATARAAREAEIARGQGEMIGPEVPLAQRPDYVGSPVENLSDEYGDAFIARLDREGLRLFLKRHFPEQAFTDADLDSVLAFHRNERGMIPPEVAQGAEAPLVEASRTAQPPIELLLTRDEIRQASEIGLGITRGKEAEIRAAIEQGKERRFATQVRTAARMPEEVRAELTARPVTYDPIPNPETMARATEILDTDPLKARSLVFASDGPTDDITGAVSQLMIDRAAIAGNFDEVVQITRQMAPRWTEAGRGVQIAAQFNRQTPGGALRYAQKLVLDGQEHVKGLKLTPEKAQEIYKRQEAIEAMPEGRAKTMAGAVAHREVLNLLPPSVLEKLNLYRTWAMLSLPKSLVRNTAGNTLDALVTHLRQVLEVPIDIGVSALTRKRTAVMPSLGTKVSGAIRGAREGFAELRAGVNLRGIQTAGELPRQPRFTSGPFMWMERYLGASLGLPDRIAYEAAKEDSIRVLSRVQAMNEGKAGAALGKRELELIQQLPKHIDEASDLAGLEAIFQDDNVLATIFVGAKELLNKAGFGRTIPGHVIRETKEFGMGSLVMPFAKTPGALVYKGLKYTPLSWGQAVIEIAKPLVGKPFNQKAAVSAIATGTIGYGLTTFGQHMTDAGIMTGPGVKDPDVRNLERQVGRGPFKFNTTAFNRYWQSGFDPKAAKLREGDRWLSYEWILPISIPLNIGATTSEREQRQRLQKGKVIEQKGLMEQINDIGIPDLLPIGDLAVGSLTSVAAALDMLAVQPMAQGMKKLFGYENPGDGWLKVILDAPASFVPSLVNGLNVTLDNTARERYDPDATMSALNYTLSRIPGLSALVMPKIDMWGEDVERYQNDSNNPFNVFFNPTTATQYFPSREAELLLGLYEATGEKGQIPNPLPKEITITNAQGKHVKYQLSAQQFRDYQRATGLLTQEAFKELAESSAFQNATDEDKIHFLTRVGTAARFKARELLHERYQNDEGGVIALPPIPKEELGKGKLIDKDVRQVFADEQTLKPYEAVPLEVQAASKDYRLIQELHDTVKAGKPVTFLGHVYPTPEALEQTATWKVYRNAIDKKRDVLRAYNREIREAGIRLGRWDAPKPKSAYSGSGYSGYAGYGR